MSLLSTNVTLGVLAAGGAELAQGGHQEGATIHWLIIILMMTGLYILLSRSNMVKTIIGLNIFQAGVILFYVSMGRVEDGTAPILINPDSHSHEAEHSDSDVSQSEAGLAAIHSDSLASAPATAIKAEQIGTPRSPELRRDPAVNGVRYSNPLPHVLMLTAIVVGVATTALALALVLRINEYYGTIEEDDLDVKGVGR